MEYEWKEKRNHQSGGNILVSIEYSIKQFLVSNVDCFMAKVKRISYN